MTQPTTRLKNDELLAVLSMSDNATAIYTTEQLIIESANNAMKRFWHKDYNVIGLPFAEALPELKGQPFIGLLQNVWRTGETYEAKDTPAELMADGRLQTFYFNFTYRAIKNNKGEVYCILHTATDVTAEVLSRVAADKARQQEEAYKNEQLLNEQLQQAQQNLAALNNELQEKIFSRTEALATSEARIRYMLSDAPVGIGVFTGPDFMIESANETLLKFLGKSNTIIAMPLAKALPELEDQPFLALLDNVFTTGKPYRGYEAQAFLERNNILEEGYYNFVFHPLTNSLGHTEGIMVVANDVTEQVKARRELEKLYEQARLSKQTADLGTFDLDLPKGTMEWDERCRVLFGISHNNSVSYEADFLPGLHPDDRERISRVIDDAFVKERSNGNYDVEYRTIGVEDKQLRWVRAKGKVLFDEQDVPVRFIGSVMEVTEQVKARQHLEEIIAEKTVLEATLRANEQRLQSILDTMAEGVGIVDINGQVVYANPMAQKIFGLSEKDIKQRAYKGPQWQNVKIDGTPLPDEEHPIAVMMATGKTVYDCEVAVQPPGKERIYVSINAAPLFDANGKLTGGVGTFMDVTARRKDIQQKDDFISIASHELKTPVTSLKASLQLLDRMKANPQQTLLPKLIDQCNKSVAKISSLIEELLNASQVTQGLLQLHKTTFTLAEMINGCCNHVRMAGTHELISEGDDKLQICADEHRIDQVVVNLVNNAVKYAPQSKNIYLIVENMGSMAKISVKDNGPGISPEKLPYLFDRYYRATAGASQYSGLGLGLYISAEIIKKHGGQIGVDSELGKGSTFWFTLPL